MGHDRRRAQLDNLARVPRRDRPHAARGQRSRPVASRSSAGFGNRGTDTAVPSSEPPSGARLRLLRLLRLLKAGALARRLLSTEGVRDAAVLALVTVLGGGAAFAAVEKSQDLSAWDGVWWAMTTVTTVGYGTPEVTTDGGRVIAIVVMLVGIGFVAILTAAAADRFLRAQRQEASELRGVHDRLDEIAARLDAMQGR